MPFLFRRIRENLYLFTAIGLIYFLIYKNVHMPDNAIALPIACGGFLAVAMFLYEYFLYLYLINIGNPNIYLVTNLAAYAVYMILFYIIYFLSIYHVPTLGNIYQILFKLYSLFEFTGISTGLSALAVHGIFLAAVIVTPFFVKDNSSTPLDEYLNYEK